MPTFLQMPPEMGHVRFGPFPAGIINIGSDPHRCQIVLAANLGIFPVHCTISDMGNGTYTVAPTQKNLALFLIQKGTAKAWPVEGAVQGKPGDVVVLGSQGGPRFELQHEGAGPPRAAAPVGTQGEAMLGSAMRAMTGSSGGLATRAAPSSGGNSLAKGVLDEAARQARARLVHRNPFFRTLYQLQVKWKTGVWKNPYYIVSFIGTVFTVLAGGAVTCSGFGLALLKLLLGS